MANASRIDETPIIFLTSEIISESGKIAPLKIRKSPIKANIPPMFADVTAEVHCES
jgi:hypothetical protein